MPDSAADSHTLRARLQWRRDCLQFRGLQAQARHHDDLHGRQMAEVGRSGYHILLLQQLILKHLLVHILDEKFHDPLRPSHHPPVCDLDPDLARLQYHFPDLIGVYVWVVQ